MGKIFSPPEELIRPEIVSGQDINEYFKRADEYVQSIRDWAKENSDCPEAGESIRFQIADGYASYIILMLEPKVVLIHVDVGDAYQFEWVHRLTAKDIREQIQKEKALAELFSKKEK